MSKNIAILTFHRALNYGAILQSYALMTVIQQFAGVEVKIIDYNAEKFKLQYINPKDISALPSLKRKIKRIVRWIVRYGSTKKESKKFFALEQFIENNLLLTERLNAEELPGLNNTTDIFVVGSDQVWSARLTGYDEAYFLNFVSEEKKKTSYAASLKIADDEKAEDLIKKYLPSFDAISVREQNAAIYLKDKFDIDSVCVLDPTFLLKRDRWIDLIKDKYTEPLSGYVLIYLVSQQEKLLDYAFDYAKTHGLEIVSLTHLNGRRGYKDLSDSSIEQFLGLINDAECVFTTSFHGLALSINLHIDFYFETPQSSTNNNDRLLDITQKLGLSERNVANGLSDNQIDWEAVESKLNMLRKESMDFLKNAIGIENNE